MRSSIYKCSALTFRATYVSKFSSMLVSFLSLLGSFEDLKPSTTKPTHRQQRRLKCPTQIKTQEGEKGPLDATPTAAASLGGGGGGVMHAAARCPPKRPRPLNPRFMEPLPKIAFGVTKVERNPRTATLADWLRAARAHPAAMDSATRARGAFVRN